MAQKKPIKCQNGANGSDTTVPSDKKVPVGSNAKTVPEPPFRPAGPKGFQKGVSGNPSGRPKIPLEIVEAARARSGDALKALVEIVNDRKHPQRVMAANSLLDRGYGKPVQTVNSTVRHVDPNTISDAELAAIIRGASGTVADVTPKPASKLN